MHSTNFFTRTALLALLLGVAGAASAVPIYKWKDAKGQVHYSGVAPYGAHTEVLEYVGPDNTARPIAPSAPSAPGMPTEASPEVKAAISENLETARQQCATARDNSALLKSGVRISRAINVKGDKEVLNDAQRTEEIVKAERAVQDWCSIAEAGNKPTAAGAPRGTAPALPEGAVSPATAPLGIRR